MSTTLSAITAEPSISTSPAAILLRRFQGVRQQTSSCCAALSAEDQMVQSCAEASPTKWHQAHTSWFFETFVLTPFLPDYQTFHPQFHWLFNSYYKSLGDEIPEKKLRASFSRPSLDQVLAYRAHVDRGMEQLLQRPNLEDEVLSRITLGLHHEQQHLELALTDIRHAFFTNPLHPVYRQVDKRKSPLAQPLRWTPFDGGLAQIGATPSANPLDFVFDNESPRHTVYLQPYALANRLTTTREYLAFMNDNAYSRPELWLSEGWDTVEREGWQAPLYWQRCPDDPQGWRIFTLTGWHGVDDLLESPVCNVSLFEADSYARWAGHRLPTEAEWEHAAVITAVQPVAHGDLLETSNLHPAPATSADLTQMHGGVWEWTASPYTGYPGYKALPGALGEYNGKFMSSQVILRGGSVVTPASHLRPTYRNFFSPATRWQFSGIRLAKAFQ